MNTGVRGLLQDISACQRILSEVLSPQEFCELFIKLANALAKLGQQVLLPKP